MKKKMAFIISAFILILIVFGIIFYLNREKNAFVEIGENRFLIEIAKDPESRRIGLMNRSFLQEDKGMLFIFDKEAKTSFWMKNTLIPLDIIWISKAKKIVYIAENAQPCLESCKSIVPDKEAKYVLEINGGLSSKLGISIGDSVKIVY